LMMVKQKTGPFVSLLLMQKLLCTFCTPRVCCGLMVLGLRNTRRF
jgi:hypothetical protein